MPTSGWRLTLGRFRALYSRVGVIGMSGASRGDALTWANAEVARCWEHGITIDRFVGRQETPARRGSS